MPSQSFRLITSPTRTTDRITITPTCIKAHMKPYPHDALVLVEPHIREFLAQHFPTITHTLRGALVIRNGRWVPLFLHARTPKETKVWQLNEEEKVGA